MSSRAHDESEFLGRAAEVALEKLFPKEAVYELLDGRVLAQAFLSYDVERAGNHMAEMVIGFWLGKEKEERKEKKGEGNEGM